MEEKERYEVFGKHCIKDNNPDARPQLLDAYVACVILNEQDKRIKELEQENLFLKEQNQQLKQQLHDLPKKIVEDISLNLSENVDMYFEVRESTSPHCPNAEYNWFNYVRFNNFVRTILKKYGGEDEV